MVVILSVEAGPVPARKRVITRFATIRHGVNSSTVVPALRIKARRVPIESSLCYGIERLTRNPCLVMTMWLPTWPTTCQPLFSKALTASLPERLASLPMSYCYGDGFLLFLFRKGGQAFLIYGPEPEIDGFFDVFYGVLFGFTLRHATWKRWALCNNPSILSRFQSDMKIHVLPYVWRQMYGGSKGIRTPVFAVRVKKTNT